MKQQWLRFLLIFISLLPILILRDFTPDNELKYLSIADEAIRDGNIFAFYNHGVAYADKPPLYIWAIMLGKLLFGKHIMFFISLLSVIPAFITLSVMGKWCKKLLTSTSTVNAELMLVTSVYFLAPIIVLRMDMLMTMFITLALYTFYRMYEHNHYMGGSLSGQRYSSIRRYNKWRWLLPLYIFFALFTKGPVGILMPLLSITVFLAINGEIRTIGKYLGWRCWALLASLCAVWFTCVYLDGGEAYLNNLLFNQTVNRAVDAFHHKKPFYFYGVAYWFSLAPWSLLAFAVILLGYCKKMMGPTLLKFFATSVASTLLMLSAFSSKLEIYMLPCFPLIIYGTAILLQGLKDNKLVRATVIVPAAIFIIAALGSAVFMIFMGDKAAGILPEMVNGLWAPAYIFVAVLGIGGALALYYIFKFNEVGRAINSIAVSMLAMIFLFSFSMPAVNSEIGLKKGCEDAMELAKEKNISNFAYYKFKTGDNLDVYLNQSVKLLEEADFQQAGQADAPHTALSNTIVFTKHKYIKRDSLLNKAAQDKEIRYYGQYALIAFE